MKRPVSFSVSLPDVVLTADEVWPDGDAPENPTANDVVGAMEAYGSPTRVLFEWNLAPEIEVFGHHDASRAVLR